jgi:hypothetical protein
MLQVIAVQCYATVRYQYYQCNVSGRKTMNKTFAILSGQFTVLYYTDIMIDTSLNNLRVNNYAT